MSWRLPLLVLLLLTSASIELVAQDVSAEQPEAVVPSRTEVAAQNQAILALERLDSLYRVQQARLNALEDSLRTASQQERARLDRELAQQRDRASRAERDFRIAVVSGWAHSTRSITTGLTNAAAVAEVGNLVLVYRPGDGGPLSTLLDGAGRLAAVGGALLGATDRDRTQLGLLIAAAGLAAHNLVQYARDYLGDEGPELRAFVDRATMHKMFAADVIALKMAVNSILPDTLRLTPVADSLITVGTANPNHYANFKVSRSLVRDYQGLIASYSALVSQLQRTNSLATQVLGDTLVNGRVMQWSPDVAENLRQTRDRTAAAIRAWRREILVAEGQLANLTRLADVDDAVAAGAPVALGAPGSRSAPALEFGRPR